MSTMFPLRAQKKNEESSELVQLSASRLFAFSRATNGSSSHWADPKVSFKYCAPSHSSRCAFSPCLLCLMRILIGFLCCCFVLFDFEEFLFLCPSSFGFVLLSFSVCWLCFAHNRYSCFINRPFNPTNLCLLRTFSSFFSSSPFYPFPVCTSVMKCCFFFSMLCAISLKHF